MKCFLILTLVLILTQIEAKHKRRYDAEEICTTELRLSRKKMKAIINEDNTPEDHKKYGKYLLCVFHKRGILNKKGVVNESGLRSFLDLVFDDHSSVTMDTDAAIEQVFEKCKGIKRDKPAKTAVQLKNCIIKNVRAYDSE